MKQEINPQETNRAQAFELWMKSPMPMVNLTKTFDVTRLYKVSRRKGFEQFNAEYLTLTQSVSLSCNSTFEADSMVIGTSAMTTTELDGIINQYTDQFCNPMVMWGKYRKGWFKVTLPISFQFHHVQMDGGHGARFLDELQKTIKVFEYDNNIEYN